MDLDCAVALHSERNTYHDGHIAGVEATCEIRLAAKLRSRIPIE